MRTTPAVLGAIALAIATGTRALAAPAPAPATLTVEDAVALAMQSSPRLAAARARVAASGEVAASAGSRLLPSVRVFDELQVYDSPFAITFQAPAMPPAAQPPATTFPARNQTTNTFTASVDQPLLGLMRLQNDRQSQVEQSAAVASELAVAESDVRQSVETQFLRYFEARAMRQIAEASARELGQQVTTARARLASGVITRADLLRLEVAVANAHQQALQADSQAAVARAALQAIIGIPADAGAVTLVEPAALLAAARAVPPPLPAALGQARAHRPELQERGHLVLAADHQASARTYALLPDLDLEAAYVRTDGQVFAPPNSEYVGLRAQWAIWEWGATEHLRRAARVQVAAARRDVEATERQVDAEVVSSLAVGDAARGAVGAAETAIASAEEAFRETEAQVNAGTATTTDLLEAESALTQARLNLTRAQYELALAQVSLAHAQGR